MTLGDFHFLRPLWLLALPVILLIAVILLRSSDRTSDWRRVVDPALFEALGSSGQAGRRWWIDLCIGGLVFAIVALAGPSLHRTTQTATQSAAVRVVVLDISLSMYAQDVTPSRMIRATRIVRRLFEDSRGVRTALIAYAGDAWIVSPLTSDSTSLTNMLGILTPAIAPVQGSRPDLALRIAAQVLQDSGSSDAEILLVTDGFRRPERVNAAAQKLADRGIVVSVLAAGTDEGARIPLRTGGFVKDFKGEAVVARTDLAALAELANVGGGEFVDLKDTDAVVKSLKRLIAPPASGDSLDQGESEGVDVWRDDGPWLLLPLLLLAALGFRRGWLMMLPVAISLTGFVPAPVSADATDLFFRDDQQAATALKRGDYDKALELAPTSDWMGTISYRRGDYAAAAMFFADMDTADAHYNRGNALALANRLPESVEAYNAALSRQADHEDALFNRGLVQELMEKQQQRQQSSDATFDDAQGTGEADAGSNATTDNGEKTGGEGEQGDETTDAALQAMGDNESETGETPVEPEYTEVEPMDRKEIDAWLRRVPDDPGGLIRRRFSMQQNMRRGRTTEAGQGW